jgi:hypothetical protein
VPETAPENGEPQDEAPKARLGRSTRKVREIYRITAVRRQPRAASTTADEARVRDEAAVTDEEIVHTLWTQKASFEERLTKLANERTEARTVLSVELLDARPSSSVLLELLYQVEAARGAAAVAAGFTAAVILAVAEQLEQALGSPVAVAATPGPAAPGAAAGAEPAPASGWGTVGPVLGAIATGIGVIGFVTFIGGLIVWARLNGAGFPAGPALSVYAKQDLLVIGAQTLVPQILAALVVVAVFSACYVGARAVIDRVGEEEAALLRGQATFLGGAIMFMFVLAALGVTLLLALDGLKKPEPLIALGIAGGFALVAAVVGGTTRRFLYLAVTSFLMVGVFMTVLAYWKARNDHKVRGAAVIRENRQAIAGIFLTEGSGRVYLARVTLDKSDQVIDGRSRIVGIDKSQITDLAIAGAKEVTRALADARALRHELCDLQPRPKEDDPGAACPPTKRKPPPDTDPPTITPYAGGPLTLDGDGAAVVTLPPLAEDATGVVSFVTRDRVAVADSSGRPRRERIALSTKAFRAEAGRPVRIRVHLSRRARRAIDDAGGAFRVRMKVVATGKTGLAARNDEGCIVLRRAHARRSLAC